MSNETLQPTAASVQAALAVVASPEDAKFLAGYFQTQPGGYGEGDIFIGVRVPNSRAVAKHFKALPLEELEILLESPIHEHRLTALHIIVGQFERAKTKVARKELFDFYLHAAMRGRINNWDLVDTSAPTLGKWLVERPNKTLLISLAKSEKLWERRLGIMFTFAHIRAGDYGPTQHLAMILMGDTHDLIHKAVGWMLREIGNRDEAVLLAFLEKHYAKLPRTALRYAIEKLPEETRQYWLKRK